MKKNKTILVLAFACQLLSTAVFAQLADKNTWFVDGNVKTIAVDSNYTYIGGDFTHVSPYTGGGIKMTDADVAPDLNYPRVEGQVYTVISDGGGGWYVGGYFEKIGGHQIRNIAHIRSDKSVDLNWKPDPNGMVNVIVKKLNVIYVGGDYSTIGGQNRNNVAGIDSATGNAAAWNPNSSGGVNAIVIQDSHVYVGGSFTNVGGQNRKGLAKLELVSGNVDLLWNPDARKNINSLQIIQMVTYNNYLYVIGNFDSIGGQSRYKMAKLNLTDGAADAVWNPNPDYGGVYSIAVDKLRGDIYVGGPFTVIGGRNRFGLARISSTTGAADPSWVPGPNNDVRAITLNGNDIYIGGGFIGINQQTHYKIARVSVNNPMPTLGWIPYVDGNVYAIALYGSDIYVGGAFYLAGGHARNRIARLKHTDGSSDESWNPDANGEVNSIALNGNDVYVGGSFSQIGSEARNNIAKLNKNNGLADAAWNPNADNVVHSVAVAGSSVYAGGEFSTIGGASRSFIAKLDAWNGAADFNWNPSANGWVMTMATGGNYIYAGGLFTQMDGITRNRIARFNALTGKTDTTWNPDATNDTIGCLIMSIAATSNAVYAGGFYSGIGGLQRNNLARLNLTDGKADATWNPNPNNGSSPLALINTIAVNNNDVFVSGSFNIISGLQRQYIAKLDGTTGALDNNWNPVPDNMVNAIAVRGTDVYLGGAFTTIRGQQRSGFAKLSTLLSSVSTTGSSPQFNLYPNPANSHFIVASHDGSSTISVIDINGKVVMNQFTTQLQTTVDVQHLPSGIYFVKLINHKGIAVKRLMKTN